MPNAPILLFVFNRPVHTQKTVEALQHNDLAQQSDLFIFSDGPRHARDVQAVESVRNYIKGVGGFKSVTIIERATNVGLSTSIVGGVTDIINKTGRVIVLEDDLVTSPYFLRYMNDALELYEHETKVISVHGYVYPVKGVLPETFFIKGADCWGWATWKRGWDMYQQDGKKLLTQIQSAHRTKEFNFDGSYPFTQMLKAQTYGLVNSWAIRWYASAFLSDALTLYPGKSLVSNCGLDDSGTHTGKTSLFDVGVSTTPVQVKRLSVCEDVAAKRIIIQFFKSPALRMFLFAVRLHFYIKLVRTYVKKIGQSK